MENKSLALREANKGLQGNEMSGPNQSLGGAITNLQQWTERFNVVDKQSGSYMRSSVKESSSSGDVFKERGSGRVGFKDEEKVTTTVKIGDKTGYSEYQVEKRFRNVSFGDGNKNTPSAGINSNPIKQSERSDVNSSPVEFSYKRSHEVAPGVADSWDNHGDDSDDYDDDYSNDHSYSDDSDDDYY